MAGRTCCNLGNVTGFLSKTRWYIKSRTRHHHLPHMLLGRISRPEKEQSVSAFPLFLVLVLLHRHHSPRPQRTSRARIASNKRGGIRSRRRRRRRTGTPQGQRHGGRRHEPPCESLSLLDHLQSCRSQSALSLLWLPATMFSFRGIGIWSEFRLDFLAPILEVTSA